MKAIFVFPGQGSQFPGMGKPYFENFKGYRLALEEASDASAFDLKKLSLEASDSELKESSVSQPLILSVSVGIWRVLQAEYGLEQRFEALFAGHSLGEYTALVAAGAIPFAECVRAVQNRGRCMSEAVAPGLGGMRALILREVASEERILDLCSEARKKSGKLVAVANWNSDTQVVLSGFEEGLKAVDEICGSEGDGKSWKWIKRSIPLDVSGPFHSPLMEAARKTFAPFLANLKINPQKKSYIRNIDATCVEMSDSAELRRSFEEQICSGVRWYPSLLKAKEWGVQIHAEIGPSRVLSNMASRAETLKGWKFLSFEDPKKVEEVLS